MSDVTVIGAGLAGCEAANALAAEGIKVRLFDIKPNSRTPAHHSDNLAELVCSNSLRAAGLENAAGLLKQELRMLGSVVMEAADHCAVAAGGALAVDRTDFETYITRKIKGNPNIEYVCEEITQVDGKTPVIIATGPLTTDALSRFIAQELCPESLYFFDAAAPIVTLESLDRNKVFFASRYGKGGADYINCPFDAQEYDAFYQALINAETTQLQGFEGSEIFEGCMPVEVMASRGYDTLRYGPMKPVGLIDPKTGREPFACVQLRKDNSTGTLYNLVGFQTHLKFGEQQRVFGMIPGLASAEFVRYGVMHRNTFINSPKFLDYFYRLRSNENIYFAGQMTGVEGYIESAASGLLAGFTLSRILKGKPPVDFTDRTAIGALGHYVSNESVKDFQPMNINFGIMDTKGAKGRGRRAKRLACSEGALLALREIADKNGLKLAEGGQNIEDHS